MNSIDRTLINVADEDWREYDVAERGGGRLDARHRPRAGELLRVPGQKVDRRWADGNLEGPRASLVFFN